MGGRERVGGRERDGRKGEGGRREGWEEGRREGGRREGKEGERKGKLPICVLQATKTGEGLEMCYFVSMYCINLGRDRCAHTHTHTHTQVSQAAEDLFTLLAPALPTESAIELLSPMVAQEKYPMLLGTIKLLTKVQTHRHRTV